MRKTLAGNGIVTSWDCCGLIVTLPTNLLAKDPRFLYLAWIAVPQVKPAYYQLQPPNPATWTIIEKSWRCPWALLAAMLPRASGDITPSIRRAMTSQPKKLSFEWASGSFSDFPARKLAKTASCLDPSMVHTGLLSSTILMFLSPKCTSPVRNPFRCISHKCAYVPSTIPLDIIGMVATSKGSDVTPIGLPAWSLMMIRWHLPPMMKARCSNRLTSNAMPSGSVPVMELRASPFERRGWCNRDWD